MMIQFHKVRHWWPRLCTIHFFTNLMTTNENCEMFISSSLLFVGLLIPLFLQISAKQYSFFWTLAMVVRLTEIKICIWKTKSKHYPWWKCNLKSTKSLAMMVFLSNIKNNYLNKSKHILKQIICISEHWPRLKS